MKCKDFFNDVVAALHGKTFCIYGFDSTKIKINEEGFYVLVNHVTNPESFFHNLNIINERLEKELECKVTWQKVPRKTHAFMLLFPKEVFASTYYVSLLTLLIRWSNYEKSAEKWEDLFTIGTSHEVVSEFGPITQEAAQYCEEHGFKHKAAEKYWYYAGKSWNSNVGVSSITLVHNNGVSKYVRYASGDV